MRWQRTVGLFLLFPALILAHKSEPLQPDDLWSAWEFDPGVVIPLATSGILYRIGEKKHFGLTTLQKTCFWAGWVSLVIALISPLHPLGEVLFSAHMVQHEVLMLISAPLLVLSRPLVTFLWALPMSWRKGLGRWSKQNYVTRSWHFLTDPLTAWVLHAAAIWIWHIPFLFHLTLTSELAHTAQHLSFFFSGLLFWWAIFYAKGQKAYGSGILYVFTTAVHTGILGALLTFAPHVWYPAYSKTTQAWGFTPLEDQQVGGLIMWVPASLVYLAAGLTLCAGWLKESDARFERLSSAK
ncbi:MAG: cytochrome c oxidase assembly protein [Acidobacteriaceae bacterium]|nr:cytochrome c oxidase assembly protein [Acidobacteriaceae bacterium]